ncbi:hypothetical protein PH213_35395 [Streptomyces sp. SRF1]|uniref:hypothetical protein n=1 Tax=Streptomyces sp. SRF1 TaxID=1549642 RepID=UPI0025AF4347|nr:hypothetical protein [Streptomyces sp. SRF1]MDN3059723.1 hypothetical protein [Streptomyces sp. SRF1]
MSSANSRKTYVIATVGGAFAMIAALAAPAYAGGAGGAATPIKGRTEGGSLELVNGDIVACAGVGDVRVEDTTGVEHKTDGAGTEFTTRAGTEVETLRKGTVEVTVRGASAVITCGKEGFPTTKARVPKGVLAGSGGSVTEADTAEALAGGALVASAIAGCAVALRRRRGDMSA